MKSCLASFRGAQARSAATDRTWGASGLVEKRNLRRMPRKALPVHIDTMPANEIDRLVIPMADFAACVDFSVAGHAVWASRT